MPMGIARVQWRFEFLSLSGQIGYPDISMNISNVCEWFFYPLNIPRRKGFVLG